MNSSTSTRDPIRAVAVWCLVLGLGAGLAAFVVPVPWAMRGFAVGLLVLVGFRLTRPEPRIRIARGRRLDSLALCLAAAALGYLSFAPDL